MHNAGLMRCCKAACRLNCYIQRLGQPHLQVSHAMSQCHTIDVFHRDEVTAIVSLTYFVDHTEVGMTKRRCGAGLLLESADSLLTFGEGGRKYLEGDLAAEPAVLRKVNFSHPACAEK